MKSILKILIFFILALGLAGEPSLSFAHQSNDPPSTDVRVTTPSNVVKDSLSAAKPQALLKWPRGSLIFPEINSPEKINEVFLLSETYTPYSERHSLYYHYGSQYFSRKNFGAAKRSYAKALALKSDIPAIHKRLGFLFMNSKDYKGAEAAYRKILELNPGYTPAIAQLGICLAAQRKYSLAEKHLKKAIQREPANVNYHLNLGNFYYYLKKDYRGARTSYKKALRLNPRLAKARNNIREIDRKSRQARDYEDSFENSWESDSVNNNSNESEPSVSLPRTSEKSKITSILEEGKSEQPIF